MKKLLLMLTLLVPFAACAPAQNESFAQAAEAEIYAAVVRQIYTVDDTFGGTLQSPIVYLLSETDPGAGEPGRSDGSSRQLEPELRAAISGQLEDLPATFTWVQSRADAPLNEDETCIANGGMIVSLGNIVPTGSTTAEVAASNYVCNLAAGGRTYTLESIDGAWRITGTTGVEWIS